MRKAMALAAAAIIAVGALLFITREDDDAAISAAQSSVAVPESAADSNVGQIAPASVELDAPVGWTGLVIGDSISAAYGLAEVDGWVALAENQLREIDPDARLVNASISGDTTGGGLRRLPAALERFNPDLVIIELGGNDGLRGYPTDTMQENLEAMARLAMDAGADVLLLGMMIPSNYGEAFTRRFTDAFVDAAAATDSGLVPFLLEPIAEDREYFQADGIHPTADAQPLLVEHVMPALTGYISGAGSAGS